MTANISNTKESIESKLHVGRRGGNKRPPPIGRKPGTATLLSTAPLPQYSFISCVQMSIRAPTHDLCLPSPAPHPPLIALQLYRDPKPRNDEKELIMKNNKRRNTGYDNG